MSRWDFFTIIVIAILFARAIAIFCTEESVSIKTMMKRAKDLYAEQLSNIRRCFHGRRRQNKKDTAKRED